ncbi:MAG TPA: hypothetical protein VK989_12460 [Polyangia bacterium]|nr:hypothetical protein [Polyangia bacterium]
MSDDRAAGGPTYVLRGVGFAQGDPYTLARTDRAAPIASIVGDGTAAALLAPAAGGVIVVGDGAAAQRFDATGTSLWTVGYDAVGAQAALVGDGGPDDRMIVADATTVRALAADGTITWERALDGATTGVSQVVADRAGGAWVVGAFTGDFPPWVSGVRKDGLAVRGHFILRFDGAGDVVAANAWDDTSDAGLAWTQALAVARGDGSTELVLVGGANPGSGAVPALDIARDDGDGPFVVTFDATGALLWSHPLDRGVELAADGDGNLLALSVLASSSSDAGAPPPASTGLVGSSATTSVVRSLLIERWDASGAPLGDRTAVPVRTTSLGVLTWTSAPTSGGIVVAGQWLAAPQSDESVVVECPQPAFAFRAQTESLLITPLTVVAR